jgi:hypothetical protein
MLLPPADATFDDQLGGAYRRIAVARGIKGYNNRSC